jgi:hypothetical protein
VKQVAPTGVNWRGLGGSMLLDMSHNFLEMVLPKIARTSARYDEQVKKNSRIKVKLTTFI